MIKVGIFGKGNFSSKEFDYIRTHEAFKYVGSYGSFPEMEDYKSPISLLNKVDALFIFDIEISDYKTIKEFTRKSKHIYIHDPSRLSHSQGQQLQKLAQEAGTVIQFGYSPVYSNALEILDDKYLEAPIVEIQHTIKYNNNGATLSLLNDLLLQDIEMACHFVKSEIKSVRANGLGNIEENPDQIYARLEYLNGSVVNLNISKMGVENKYISTLFHGNTQQVVNHLENSVSFFEENDLEKINMTNNFHSVSKVTLSQDNNFKKSLSDFHQCILNCRQPKSSIDSFINVKFIANFIVDQVSSNFAKI